MQICKERWIWTYANMHKKYNDLQKGHQYEKKWVQIYVNMHKTQHILGFANGLYTYILIIKNVYD